MLTGVFRDKNSDFNIKMLHDPTSFLHIYSTLTTIEVFAARISLLNILMNSLKGYFAPHWVMMVVEYMPN